MNLILISLGLSGATFIAGYLKGRSAEKIKQLKTGTKNALATKKRKAVRRNDDIKSVTNRMRKEFLRK